MKKCILIIFISLIVLANTCEATMYQHPAIKSQLEAQAVITQFITNLKNEEMSLVYDSFSKYVKTQIDRENFIGVWRWFLSEYGQLKEYSYLNHYPQHDVYRTTYKFQFEKRSIKVRIDSIIDEDESYKVHFFLIERDDYPGNYINIEEFQNYPNYPGNQSDNLEMVNASSDDITYQEWRSLPSDKQTEYIKVNQALLNIEIATDDETITQGLVQLYDNSCDQECKLTLMSEVLASLDIAYQLK